jgi:hypothetical protein
MAKEHGKELSGIFGTPTNASAWKVHVPIFGYGAAWEDC